MQLLGLAYSLTVPLGVVFFTGNTAIMGVVLCFLLNMGSAVRALALAVDDDGSCNSVSAGSNAGPPSLAVPMHLRKS